MYVLGNPPRTPNEAFDALNNVFGADEFSASEAQEVLGEILELDLSRSQNELNRLVRMDSVVEV